jgi:aminomethyltransferase
VKRKTGGFLGAEAIEARADKTDQRRLIGFKMTERGIARPEYFILKDEIKIGRVTSGAPSPTLGISIGLGYVSPEHASVGSEIAIAIRGKSVAAQVIETPFVVKVDTTKTA